MLVPFGVESYQHRSRPVSSQRMVNCYLETPPKAQDGQPPVVSSFGIEAFATVGSGTMRGGCVINGTPFVVCGSQLYRIASTGVATALGSVPGQQPVDMTGDSDEVVVVTGGTMYRYDGDTVGKITDADFPGARWVEYLDGYAVIGPGDGTVYVNQTPGDFSAWNALDFATAEGAPDDILGAIVDHRQVFLGGKETIEIWENTGNADFPLERSPGGFIELGLGSEFAFAKHSNAVFFYASDGTIRMLAGYDAQRISTHAVEQAIEQYADKSCTTIVWMESGHALIGFRFAEGMWVYDLSTQLWHERLSYGYATWRALFALRAYGQWIVGDAFSNKLGVLSAETFTEWSNVLRFSVTSPSVGQRYDRHGSMEVTFESGVGIMTGQGSDPLAMLRFSDDGGRNWSSEYVRPMGPQGDTRAITRWNRLGMVQPGPRVYEVSVSDPVRRTIIQAQLNG